MKRQAAMILVCLAALSACASEPRRVSKARWVEAEGWAAVQAGRPQDGQRRALAEAQRRAVEKGAGVRVAAATLVKDSVSLRQTLRAELSGFIERFEVLGESLEDGFHKVRIRAQVRLGQAEPGRLDAPQGEGRLSFAVQGPAARGLERGFLARGFTAAGREPSDFIVRGRASSGPVLDRRLGAFRAWRARVAIEVVEAATGEVVYSGVGESSALALDAEAAQAQAAEAAGEATAGPAAAALAELLWKRL